MQQLDDNRWCVPRPQSLHLRRWDDEVVVYDGHSGDTHILEDLAGRVLERLLCAPASADELLVVTAGCDVADPRSAGPLNDVWAVIVRLRRIGLVQSLCR